MKIDPEYGVVTEAEVGDSVWDDLLGRNSVVVRVSADEYGNVGYWLDNEYLGGGRFPWEISPPIHQ